MRQKESTDAKPIIGFLIVVFRVPVGLAGTAIVTVYFAIWLLLETTMALVAFSFAAIFANQNWIKASWLGRFPVALREFSHDGFKYLRGYARTIGAGERSLGDSFRSTKSAEVR